MKIDTNLITTITLATVLTSCATYHMTTPSMLEQFANARKEKKVNYFVAFPLVFPGVVNGNSLREIKVLDKSEKEVVMHVSHRTAVRIFTKDGKHNTFYFDTLIIQDTTITGKKDHFLGINIKPINLNDIQKIELMN